MDCQHVPVTRLRRGALYHINHIAWNCNKPFVYLGYFAVYNDPKKRKSHQFAPLFETSNGYMPLHAGFGMRGKRLYDLLHTPR